MGTRCGVCPAGEAVCPYMLWRSGCPAARATGAELAWHRAAVARMLAVAGPDPVPSARQIVAVETCDFRRSDCGCLGKPATCLQAVFPAVVGLDDCLRCVDGFAAPIDPGPPLAGRGRAE